MALNNGTNYSCTPHMSVSVMMCGIYGTELKALSMLRYGVHHCRHSREQIPLLKLECSGADRGQQDTCELSAVT